MSRVYGEVMGPTFVGYLAAGAVFLLGSAAAGFIAIREEQNIWKDQIEELEQNPEVFVISDPSDQPAGHVVASWESEYYDDEIESYEPSTVTFRIDNRGNASLSDSGESSSVIGRKSGRIAPCSSLTLDTYDTRTFTWDGKPHKLLLTSLGNAAVCSDNSSKLGVR